MKLKNFVLLLACALMTLVFVAPVTAQNTSKQDIEWKKNDKKRKKKARKRAKRKKNKRIAKAKTARGKSKVNKAEATLTSDILQEAERYIGVKHRMGGTTPKGFDCSGFTQYVFQKSGVSIPRTSRTQAQHGKKINLKAARKGDLVFFAHSSSISHVGIVVSDVGEPLKMIHASSSKGVIITNVESSKYWKKRLKSARRVL